MSSNSFEGMTHKILSESLGRMVLIKMRNGKTIRGKLKSFDIHLNVVLDDAEEATSDGWRKLGVVLVRGENVVMLSPM